MGMHTFERAPHLRVSDSRVFIRGKSDLPDPNKRSFDSSVEYSLFMAFGFQNLKLELIHEDSTGKKYNVYASSTRDSAPTWRGTLFSESPAAWRERMNARY